MVAAAGAPPAGAPNVVFIVLDDVGFSDLGCFGSEIETPHIDRLAAGGLRYTNFHTTALCSPTRACLLTGRNHHSVGHGRSSSNWDTGFPGTGAASPHSAGTLAEMLRRARLQHVRRRQVAPRRRPTRRPPPGPYDQWPLQRGFDRFYGFLDGATDQWSPDLVDDNHRIDPPRPATATTSPRTSSTSRSRWCATSRRSYPEKPFFLYLCFGAAHYPLQAPADHIDKYRGPLRQRLGRSPRRAPRAPEGRSGIVPPDTRAAAAQRRRPRRGTSSRPHEQQRRRPAAGGVRRDARPHRRADRAAARRARPARRDATTRWSC